MAAWNENLKDKAIIFTNCAFDPYTQHQPIWFVQNDSPEGKETILCEIGNLHQSLDALPLFHQLPDHVNKH